MMGGLGGGMVPLAGYTVPRAVVRRLVENPEPVGPAVSLVELKQHLRITHTTEDAYVTSLEKVARRILQKYLSRRLLSRKVVQWMDLVPGNGNDGTIYGAGTAMVPVRYANVGMFRWFDLMSMPVQSVELFSYVTLDGVAQTWPTENYIVDNKDPDQLARICLQRGSVWPVDLQVVSALGVSYTLGYQAAPWVALTNYKADDQVSNGGRRYTCTNAGTAAASGGPTGTTTGIVDGTCVWAYMSEDGTIPDDLVFAVKLIAAALWSNRGDNLDNPVDILQLPAIRAVVDPYRLRRIGTAW
jgi:hypothetical protein